MSEKSTNWFRQIDASSLAAFRIMFGALLLFDTVNYGVFLCLDCMYRSSAMLFKYHYFEWVTLWPGAGLELQFLIMGVCAIAIILGYYYRVAMAVFTVSFSYVFLLDQALYLNHFYLVILLCCIMVFLPANTMWSLDARRRPEIASDTVPAWTRILFVAQVEIVLIYAGVVKLNWDWLNLEPMRLWMNELSSQSHEIFQWFTQDPGIALASYGVLLLHLVGAPLLLWKKTRLLIFIVYSIFHVINAFVFNIGIFPWMTIGATLMFFDPDWPKQFAVWLRSKFNFSSRIVDAIAKPVSAASSALESNPSSRNSVLIVTMIMLWLTVQALVPARNWFLPGNVAWNEAGHRFSWRMKLREKRGIAEFYLVSGNKQPVKINKAVHLNRKQIRTMACIPDLIWQYAQFVQKEHIREQQVLGISLSSEDVQVYADTQCSLNTRERAPLINRLVDLTSIERDEPEPNWVLPLTKQLPKKFLSI